MTATPPPAPPLRKVLVEPLSNVDVANFVVRVGNLVGTAALQIEAGDELQALGTLRVLSALTGHMIDRLLGPKRPL